MDLALECQADEQQYKTSTEPEMTVHNYTRDNTGLLLVDPWNDVLSEGRKLHGHAKPLADEVGTLASLRSTLDATRTAEIQVYFVPHHRAIIAPDTEGHSGRHACEHLHRIHWPVRGRAGISRHARTRRYCGIFAASVLAERGPDRGVLTRTGKALMIECASTTRRIAIKARMYLSKYTLKAIAMVFMICLFLGIPFSDAGARMPTQIIMTLMLPRDKEPLGQFTYLIYREAFRRLGLELICVYLPPLRGGVEAELGSLDGELGRGKDYGISHPNLVRVEEHAIELNVSAFAVLPNLKLEGWEALRSTNYRVEYRMGMQIPQSRLEKILAPPLLSTVPTSLQGLQKLVAGRTDIYIDFDDVVGAMINSKEFSGAKKIYRIGLMEKVPIFAYLHRSKENLAPRLSLVLKEMKKDGLIETYRKEAFSTRPTD